jgi:hypothetical protein
MLRRITQIAAGALALAVVAAGAAHAGTAVAKPGFLPGTWFGKGTISGNVTDGPMSTHFSGGISFTLKVSPKLAVGGSGTRQLNMLGAQDAPSSYGVDTSMFGTASIRLAGTSTNVTYAGLQHITGEIRTAGVKRPLTIPDQKVAGRLVIKRAGKCKVTGTSTIQPGVTLSWSAQLKGSGTCNA